MTGPTDAISKARPDTGEAGGSRQALVNAEVPFAFDELFFSRTDERGIIGSGNSVFCRISQYAWSELLERPHKVIRHPDMPKAVFHLLWETIRAGRPIGAYVKNRAKDGRYYWVYALVTPIDGGYLSVRIRPSSRLLQVVEREYRDLVALEREKRLPPAQSAEMLLARLQELGFRNYDVFMASALSAEISARNEALGRPVDQEIERFDRLTEQALSLIAKSDEIFEAYLSNEHVPLNLKIHAGQLGELGAPISVISTNYSAISEEIRVGMDDFVGAANRVFDTIVNGQSLVATARIQTEMLSFSRKERESGDMGEPSVSDADLALLDAQQASYRAQARQGLVDIAREADRFRSACLEMRRLEVGLEVTRIMGKIECAHLDTTIKELDGLIKNLASFQAKLAVSLQDIEQQNRKMLHSIDRMLSTTP
ncbi:MAG: PAS domain-containing protein [Geminicoccaceae bacterium]